MLKSWARTGYANPRTNSNKHNSCKGMRKAIEGQVLGNSYMGEEGNTAK